MNSIRIRNVRSLIDTGDIDLKSINMLVGTNSSGKSTFLRIFPLLKQSFFRRINGPILWAGTDEDYVDFGSYKETINKNNKDNYIELEFTIPYELKKIRHLERYFILEMDREKYNFSSEAKLSIEISNNKDVDIVSKIKIQCNNDLLCIDNISKKKYFNGKQIKDEIIEKEINNNYIENYVKFFDERSSILNILYETFSNKNIRDEMIIKLFDDKKQKENYPSSIIDMIEEAFLDELIVEIFLNDKFNLDKFIKECKARILKENQELKNIITKVLNINREVFKNNENMEKFKVLYINEVGKLCMDYIQAYFMQINYIKPVRAHAERYYRLRNLSVDQIDADGRNLPIFINSLSEKNLKEFNTWLQENFKFEVIPVQTDGHVSIFIKVNEKKINLSDTGYRI